MSTLPEEDNDIEIVIDEDDELKGKKPDDDSSGLFDDDSVDPEIADYGKRAQERIGKLTREKNDASRREAAAREQAEEAYRYAEAVLAENRKLQQQTTFTGYDSLENAKQAAEARLERAKADYKSAMEENDTDAMVEANARLAKATSDLDRVAERIGSLPPRDQLVAQWQQEQAALQEQQRRTVQNVQPAQPDQRGLRWMERNPWFHRNRAMTSLAYGIEAELLEEGSVEQYSQEFFDRIDEEMRRRFPDYEWDDGEEQGQRQPQQQRRPSGRQPVAPVGRSQQKQGGRKAVTLTASERAVADRMGVDYKEYARQKALLEQENG